jgi:hypothetical protein
MEEEQLKYPHQPTPDKSALINLWVGGFSCPYFFDIKFKRWKSSYIWDIGSIYTYIFALNDAAK